VLLSFSISSFVSHFSRFQQLDMECQRWWVYDTAVDYDSCSDGVAPQEVTARSSSTKDTKNNKRVSMSPCVRGDGMTPVVPDDEVCEGREMEERRRMRRGGESMWMLLRSRTFSCDLSCTFHTIFAHFSHSFHTLSHTFHTHFSHTFHVHFTHFSRTFHTLLKHFHTLFVFQHVKSDAEEVLSMSDNEEVRRENWASRLLHRQSMLKVAMGIRDMLPGHKHHEDVMSEAEDAHNREMVSARMFYHRRSVIHMSLETGDIFLSLSLSLFSFIL